jgi:23S rRNA (guanine2535-N1)-methyltransferase
MPYRFAHERADYTDFAAGPVLYSLPGRPAFPVRLTSEIFQRCQAQVQRAGSVGPYTVYDPCCGSGYLLTVLAYLHWPAIRHLAGSDVDADVTPLAIRNLSLLTLAGIEARIAELAKLSEQFGKPSHVQALASARRLRERLLAYRRLPPIQSQVFLANALSAAELRSDLAPGAVDIVITDLPYGQRTSWQAARSETGEFDPEWQLLEALRGVMAPTSVVAITAGKQRKAAHDGYRRVGQLQIGKRRTLFFEPQW